MYALMLCVDVLCADSWAKYPQSTYYVLAVAVLALSQLRSLLMNLRSSQRLTFIKLLLYARHCVKSFASLPYTIIIKCFLDNYYFHFKDKEIEA